MFSRFIRSGAGSMAEALAEHFQSLAKPKPAPLAELELQLPEALAAAGTAAAKDSAREEPPQPIDPAQALDLLRHVLLGAPKPAWAGPEHLLAPKAMLDAIAPAIERLARQVERTLEYYAGSQQRRCDALHLSGEIFACPALAEALAGQLGFQPQVFDPLAILRAEGARSSPGDRMAMAPALAAALAQPGRGINLIANYTVRTAQDAKNFVTRCIILGLAGIMILIGAGGAMLERANASRRAQLEELKTQSAALGPLADDSAVSQRAATFMLRQEGLRLVDQRLLALSAVAEMGRRVPENVRLLSLTVDYPATGGGRPTRRGREAGGPAWAAGRPASGPAAGSAFRARRPGH